MSKEAISSAPEPEPEAQEPLSLAPEEKLEPLSFAPEAIPDTPPPHKGGLTRRQFLVGAGITLFSAAAGGIAADIIAHNQPGLFGIKKNAAPSPTATTIEKTPATPTPAPGETEASPADKAFAERFRQNDPETKQQLLGTAWRYGPAQADQSDPAKRVEHLPTGVVDGFVFTAANPKGERVQGLKINDPDATSKAHLLELHVPFFYTERKLVRVVDKETQTPTDHLALVATIGGYNKVAETLEDCDEGYTEEVIVGWFNPPPATEPNLGINGMSYSATGEVTAGSPDDSAVLPGTTENIEKALDEVKGQMLIVGIFVNSDAALSQVSDSQKQKYRDVVEVFSAQQPAAIALINQRGEAPFASTAAKTGATVKTGGDPTKFAWANGIEANHSHF